MKLLALWVVLIVGGVLDQRLSAQTTQTYEVTANIDVGDLLLIRANTLQWHHPGSGAAVGRHSGGNLPTTITTAFNGSVVMSNVNWVPEWPQPPPNEIRFDAYSSTLSNVAPILPAGDMAVGVSVVSGRGSVSITQLPSPTNDFTLIVRFADGASGSAYLTVRVTVQFVPLLIRAGQPGHVEVSWTTNSPPYQLESRLSSSSWNDITNEPAVSGTDFQIQVEASDPQRFFRLRKL